VLLKGFKIDSESSAKIANVVFGQVELASDAVEEIKPFAHWKTPVMRPIRVKMKKVTINRSGMVQGGGLRSWPNSSNAAL
jgi:hypothetical protein